MSAWSDFAENKLIDFFFRGQALGISGASAGAGTGPAALYVGLLKVNANDANGSTEVAGGAYARVAVASTLANWAGTHGAGTTDVSSGTGGTTSNNVAITYPSPDGADWGVITGVGVFDAAVGGNLLFYMPLAIPKTVNNGDAPPTFPAGTLTFQIDN